MKNPVSRIILFFETMGARSFFAFIAFSLFLIYNFETPPLQSPDEFNHLYRTYQISEGDFLSIKKDKRVGGEIPYSVSAFALPFRLVSSSEHVVNSFEYSQLLSQKEEASRRVFRDFPNTAQYAPVSYAPQALAFFLLRTLGQPVIIQYYGGRIAVFACWLLVMLFVLKILPAYKWLFVVLILLPMHVFLANSLSADTVTNALAVLLLALVLRAACAATQLSARYLLLVLFVCALLALAKLVYTPLALALLIIPAEAFGSRMKRAAFLISAALVCALCAAYWSGVVMENYLSDKEYNPSFRDDATIGFQADLGKQKDLILGEPGYFPAVVWRSLVQPPEPYLKSFIGFFGVYQDVVMPLYVYWVTWAGIVFVVLLDGSGCIGRRRRLVLFAAAIVSLLLLLLSQHLTWDPVGSGIVSLFQGRYLIPLMPALLIVCSGLNRRWNKAALAAVLTVVFVNVHAIDALYHRYVQKPFASSLSFHSDFSSSDIYDDVQTSDPLMVLGGGRNIDTVLTRSPGRSVVSSDRYPYVLQHTFRNMNPGDLFDVEIWKKGEGASLVLTGGDSECGDFYMANNQPDYTDANGWQHVHMQFRLPGKCRNMNVNFLVHNPTNNTVYLDDISVTVRKGQLAR